MRSKPALAATLVVLTALLGTGIAWGQHQQHHGHKDQGRPATSANDTRELVKFPAIMIEHTLANMRDHLRALQEITEALANSRHDDAAKVAEQRLGMSSLGLHGARHVARFMPQGMRDAGTAMHRAASRFAIEAQNSGVTGEMKPALAALGEVMSACVGCHAGYRLK